MLEHNMDVRQSGFTLLELIITLALIGILSAVAIARWPGDSVSLSSQIVRLAEDIRYTQALAMQRSQRTRINFAATSYTISDLTAATSYTHPGESNSTISLETGFTLTTGNTFIVFDSEGIPYSDASLPGTALSSDVTVTLTAPDSTNRTLTINPETGKVTL